MSEKDLGEMATTANAAKDMINNHVFKKAHEAMNAQIAHQILVTPPEAAVERERLYAMYKAGQMFVQQFTVLMHEYEMETQENLV